MRTVTVINPKKVNKTDKLRVAVYVRVSTDRAEQLQSFNAQVEHYQGFVNSNPEWKLSGVYADEGISGTKKEKRTEFLRLLSDCENKNIDFIITKSISRFARNTIDCLEIVRRLTELCVYILFEKENINTKIIDSELLLTLLSSLAAEESKSISQNTKWSIQKRFKNGTYKLSSAPYGYDYIGDTIIPNIEQAKAVKRMFRETQEGIGARTIAAHLDCDGIKPPRGNKWSGSTIREILQNEKYIGDVLYQKTYRDDNFVKHRNNGEKDKFYVTNHHEAIVSKEEFEPVRDIIKQRGLKKGITKHSTKYLNRYPFSGIITCNECGGTFKRRIHYANKPGQYIAWCCTTHINTNGKDCSMLFVKDENIKQAFAKMMNKLYLNRNQILKPLLCGRQEPQQKDCEGKYFDICKLDEQIDELHKKEQANIGLYTGKIIEPTQFYKRQNELQAELVRLKEKKSILNSRSEEEKSRLAETNKLYKYFNNEKGSIQEYNDELFIEFVTSIVVLSPTEMGFKLKNGLLLRERIER